MAPAKSSRAERRLDRRARPRQGARNSAFSSACSSSATSGAPAIFAASALSFFSSMRDDVGGAADRRSAGSRRPRCRGRPAAPRPAPAAAPDRPRRPARRPRRSGRAARPSRAAATFSRSAKKSRCSSSARRLDRSPSCMAARSCSGRRSLFSRTMRMTPSAARRSAKGSCEPVGFSPIGEEADQRVELVGQRDGDRHRRGRAAVVRARRRVVVADRVGDRRRQLLAAARSSGP